MRSASSPRSRRRAATGPTRRGIGEGRLRHDRLLVSCGHRRHHHPPGMPGMIGPPEPPTATPSPARTSQAASRRRCSRGTHRRALRRRRLAAGQRVLVAGHTVALTKHLGERMEAFAPGVHGSPINPLVGCTRPRIPLHFLRHDAAHQVLGRRVQAHGPRRSPTIRGSPPSS